MKINVEKILVEIHKFRPDIYELAMRASLAIRIEPSLLRRLRLIPDPTLDADTELDVDSEVGLWHSPLVEFSNSVGVILLPAIAVRLRQELLKKAELFQECLAIMKDERDPKVYNLLLRETEELCLAISQSENNSELGVVAQRKAEDNIAHIYKVLEIPEAPGRLAAHWVYHTLPKISGDMLKKWDVYDVVMAKANEVLGKSYQTKVPSMGKEGAVVDEQTTAPRFDLVANVGVRRCPEGWVLGWPGSADDDYLLFVPQQASINLSISWPRRDGGTVPIQRDIQLQEGHRATIPSDYRPLTLGIDEKTSVTLPPHPLPTPWVNLLLLLDDDYNTEDAKRIQQRVQQVDHWQCTTHWLSEPWSNLLTEIQRATVTATFASGPAATMALTSARHLGKRTIVLTPAEESEIIKRVTAAFADDSGKIHPQPPPAWNTLTRENGHQVLFWWRGGGVDSRFEYTRHALASRLYLDTNAGGWGVVWPEILQRVAQNHSLSVQELADASQEENDDIRIRVANNLCSILGVLQSQFGEGSSYKDLYKNFHPMTIDDGSSQRPAFLMTPPNSMRMLISDYLPVFLFIN